MDDTWFAGVAEYHELFMGAAWQRTMSHVEPAVAEALGTSAGPIVEFGAGSGIRTAHLHERFPHLDALRAQLPAPGSVPVILIAHGQRGPQTQPSASVNTWAKAAWVSGEKRTTVSYTHLTLPTILLV